MFCSYKYYHYLCFNKKPKAMNIEKSIERFERVMDKISMPIALLGTIFLIGRAIASFVFDV